MGVGALSRKAIEKGLFAGTLGGLHDGEGWIHAKPTHHPEVLWVGSLLHRRIWLVVSWGQLGSVGVSWRWLRVRWG